MSNVKKNYYSVEKMWTQFLAQHPENLHQNIPESFYFCDNEVDANVCADLVVKGIKQATATSLWYYKYNNEPIPKVGDQHIITDWDGIAKAIIEFTQIDQVPYNKVTAEFAKIEGEGDKSLVFWRRVHKAYYKREMEPTGATFDENMIIVCEQFRTIFT